MIRMSSSSGSINSISNIDNDTYTHYKTSLESDLKVNSKPIINFLTVLAEDHKDASFTIVKAIEDHIYETAPEHKLLGLYLMDSIIKNLRETNYLQLFQDRIVKLFVNVFESVEENTRRQLYKLRQTWPDVFTNRILYSIDIAINNIDPAWPITVKLDNINNNNTANTVTQPLQQQNTNTTASNMKPISPVKPQTTQQPSSSSPPSQPQAVKVVTPPTIDRKKKQSSFNDELNNHDELITKTTTTTSTKQPITTTTSASKQLSPTSEMSRIQEKVKQLVSSVKQQQNTKISDKQQHQKSQQISSSSLSKGNDEIVNRDPRLIKQQQKPKQQQPVHNVNNSSQKQHNTTSSDNNVSVGGTKSPSSKSPARQSSTNTVKSTSGNSKILIKKSPTSTTTSKSPPSLASSTSSSSVNKKPIKRSSPPESSENIKKQKFNSNEQQQQHKKSTFVNAKPQKQQSTISSGGDKTKEKLIKSQKTIKQIEKKSLPSDYDEIFSGGDRDFRPQPQPVLKETQKIIKPLLEQSIESKDELMDTGVVPTNVDKLIQPPVIASVPTSGVDVIKKLLDVIASTQTFPPPSTTTTDTNTITIQQPPSLVSTVIPSTTPSITVAPTPLFDSMVSTAPSTSLLLAATTSTEASSIDNKQVPLNKPPPSLMDLNITHVTAPSAPVPPSSSSTTTSLNPVSSYVPPIKPRDKHEQEDSLLVIDGRSYRIQPDQRMIVKIYYHDHELFCDTRSKDVYIDSKRVYRMGDITKEIMLNGRKVRLMYMGKRIELWINGISYHFRADAPPKQVTITGPISGYTKRYYVTIDGRTMEMYFNNYKVCNLNVGLRNREITQTVKLAPDDFETHEIGYMCPPKRIMIDDQPRIMRYDLPIPCVEIDGQFYIIKFSGAARSIMIDDQMFDVPFEGIKRIKLNGRAHELAWGGPGFEVIIDGRPYELQFGQMTPREIYIGARQHFICLPGGPPDVRICGRVPDDILQQYQQQLTEQSQSQAPTAAAAATNLPTASLNVEDLLKDLMKHNLIPKKDDDKVATSNVVSDTAPVIAQKEEVIPDLTSLNPDLLKQKYNQAIQNLYSGVQCATCGIRFPSKQSNRYSNHYDWHFRQNKKEKEEINIAHSRNWYYDLHEWIQYEELSEEDQQREKDETASASEQQPQPGLNSTFSYSSHNNNENNHDESVQLNSTFSNQTSRCAATKDIDDCCSICKDAFEIYWDTNEEVWYFNNALRVGNKVYHPVCYEDAKDDSSVPSSPNVNGPTTSSDLYRRDSLLSNNSTSDIDNRTIDNQLSSFNTLNITNLNVNMSSDANSSIINTTNNDTDSQLLTSIKEEKIDDHESSSLMNHTFEDSTSLLKDEPTTP